MKHLLCILLLTLMSLPAMAQRTVTPVTPVTSRPTAPAKGNKPKEIADSIVRPASVIERTDDTGRKFLVDTLSGNEWIDSIALAQPKVIGNIYPLLNDVSFGIDLWPAIARAWGEKQGIGGIWARLSLHNRYFPVVEAGISSASSTPDGMNFSYRQPLAPYFKVGIDYNFLYNSNPNYQIYALLRYGISHFSYEVNDISVTNSYWDITQHPALPRQTTTNGYIEVGAGVVVKLFGPISAGWNVKFHKIIHHSAETYGVPLAVPGYGKSSIDLGVQLSIIYTLPLHRNAKPASGSAAATTTPKE